MPVLLSQTGSHDRTRKLTRKRWLGPGRESPPPPLQQKNLFCGLLAARFLEISRIYGDAPKFLDGKYDNVVLSIEILKKCGLKRFLVGRYQLATA